MNNWHLTTEEMREILDNLDIHPPCWSSERHDWVQGELYQKLQAIAVAQAKKLVEWLETQPFVVNNYVYRGVECWDKNEYNEFWKKLRKDVRLG